MTTAALFVSLVAVMLVVAGVALVRHGGPGGRRALAVVAALHIALPAVLAATGRLEPTGGIPLVMPLILLIMIATVVLSLSPVGHGLATSLSLGTLVGYQVFRVPLELLLHRLATEGTIPVVMTYAGWNFDIVTGLTAAIVGLWLARGRVPAALVLAWNVMGLALLVIIVVIAVLAAPRAVAAADRRAAEPAADDLSLRLATDGPGPDGAGGAPARLPETPGGSGMMATR